jgi:hypothetical protein
MLLSAIEGTAVCMRVGGLAKAIDDIFKNAGLDDVAKDIWG